MLDKIISNISENKTFYFTRHLDIDVMTVLIMVIGRGVLDDDTVHIL